MSVRYDYHRPRAMAEALDLGAREGMRYVAGGTDLIVRIQAGRERPRGLVSLRRVDGMAGIATAADGSLAIGGATTLTDVLLHPDVPPVLAEALRRMGTMQIRNSGTLGGNLCNASPCADGAPPLIVLGARVRIASPAGAREVACEDFFRGPGTTCLLPGEMLAAILVPPAPPRARGAFLKQVRVGVDLALVNAAAQVEVDGGGHCVRARLAVGAVGPTPLRLSRAEALLQGQEISREILARVQDVAREDVRPISDLRASADYRRDVAGVLVRRAVESAAGGSPPSW